MSLIHCLVMMHSGRVRLRAILCLVALLCIPHTANADSDGLYCQGKAYIAYELRHFESDGKHTLYILKPTHDEAAVSVNAIPIPKEIKQAHGLTCEDNNVLISAHMSAARFNLSDRTFTLGQEPVVSIEQNRLDISFNSDVPPVTPLSEWSNDTHRYQFHRVYYAFPENGIIQHYSINRIVRVNKELQSVEGMYTVDRMHIETID